MNLARKDKQAEPSALVLARGDPGATGRGRDGPGARRRECPGQLGTPAVILDVELPEGEVTTPIPSEFQACFCRKAKRRSLQPAEQAKPRSSSFSVTVATSSG